MTVATIDRPTVPASNPTADWIDQYALDRVEYQVSRIGRDLGLHRHDQEEVRQELLMDLWVAAPKYDPEIASRRTFVSGVVARSALRVLRQDIVPSLFVFDYEASALWGRGSIRGRPEVVEDYNVRLAASGDERRIDYELLSRASQWSPETLPHYELAAEVAGRAKAAVFRRVFLEPARSVFGVDIPGVNWEWSVDEDEQDHNGWPTGDVELSPGYRCAAFYGRPNFKAPGLRGQTLEGWISRRLLASPGSEMIPWFSGDRVEMALKVIHLSRELGVPLRRCLLWNPRVARGNQDLSETMIDGSRRIADAMEAIQ